MIFTAVAPVPALGDKRALRTSPLAKLVSPLLVIRDSAIPESLLGGLESRVSDQWYAISSADLATSFDTVIREKERFSNYKLMVIVSPNLDALGHAERLKAEYPDSLVMLFHLGASNGVAPSNGVKVINSLPSAAEIIRIAETAGI